MSQKSSHHKNIGRPAKFNPTQVLVLSTVLAIFGLVSIYASYAKRPTSGGGGGGTSDWQKLAAIYNCSNFPTLSAGSTGGCVQFVQFVVEVADGHIGGPPAITGTYDANTSTYITEFQGQHRIRASGNVDAKTWSGLQSCMNLSAPSINSIWTCQALTP